MQDYWEQWENKYLASLREQHSSQRKKHFSGETVAVGKIDVLIHDETLRNQWN